ncbi:hypothetical protein JIG36_11180 [Actinoplanes sp. LDG1-06]|uniref:Lipoprotein n=1 Tax=Paractinoplanes ovalisporus TaxID=2810368 RepID=A0ABS2A8E1_9ACTN|nr:hypothetical protein [Actinoplanes ovalisporus]MBM2616119.1 hypothetical protein [Actinoplanes ovalisporus]
MKRYGSALLVLTTAGALLAGCGVPTVGIRAVSPASGASGAPAPDGSAAPDPATDDATEVFKAALRKTHNATYKYSVNSQLPDKQRVTGTGAYDRRTRKMQTTMKYTGGVNPHTTQTVVIGDDLWQKEPGESRWVHLDMAKLKKDSYLRVDMTDPVGLAAFSGAIKTVRRTGPNTFAGTFDPNPADTDEFLPLGAPSIIVFSIFGPDAEFSATTDANGWVTIVNAKIVAKETVKMTTKFSGHGQSSGIKKPSRTAEAADFYYD